MKQFRIEVAVAEEGRFYDINPLGNAQYEISIEGDVIGKIQLDDKNPEHCESIGCQLDSPALHAIREGIQYHLMLNHEK
ncbi:hypothetical protein [Pedobacter duraquae]|uniref:Uncharacterized protein n=1 Tax=Pedobacter duraquae TaxID=425511 RepID=A0A4R6IPJ0_9SPHI|nr:hypothetical protein [Pedobacter duraquae]TDO24183.1 hypothetical protein CLV32_0471 [Pedobacter duraquae]